MWSRNHPACIECGETSRKHMSGGLCKRCYLKAYRASHAEAIAEKKRQWYLTFVAGTERGRIAREQRNFANVREAILTRDNSRCARCGSQKSLVVHHKDGNGRGNSNPNNALENLETLCRSCHMKEHRASINEIRKQNGWHHPKINRWSRKWDACRRCGTTTRAHSAHGLCRTCVAYAKTFKI